MTGPQVGETWRRRGDHERQVIIRGIDGDRVVYQYVPDGRALVRMVDLDFVRKFERIS